MTWWTNLFSRSKGSGIECDLGGELSVRLAGSLDVVRAKWQVRILDLSGSGAGLAAASLAVDSFHLHRCLAEPEGCPLELNIEFPGGKRVISQARLAWIKRDYSDPDWTYRLGLEFSQTPFFPRGWAKAAMKGRS